MSSRSPTASLLRAVIAADGRVKANFDDNTVLLLDSTGTTFTVCKPDGSQQRQLSEYAVSAHQKKVAVALEFRNTHCDKPYFCRALQLLGKDTFCTGFPIPHATWPSEPSEAAKQGLLDSKEDSTYMLCSEDDVARIVLSPYARRFAVTYPLQISEEEGPRRHTFVWQTQVFWVCDCPDRWLPALRVVLAAAGAEQPSEGQMPPATSRLTVRTPLPWSTGSIAARQALTAFPRESWWCECSTSLFPADCALVSEWRCEAMYHFNAREGEVHAVIHHDGSTLESFQDGKYFRHCRVPVSLGEMVYAAAAVPPQVRGSDGPSRYELGTMAAHASAFREAAVRLAVAHPPPTEPTDTEEPVRSQQAARGRHGSAGGGAAQKENRPPADSRAQPRNSQQKLALGLSTSVKDIREEAGVGRFTSYEDGRVRAVYCDRTILEMDSSRSSARILFPDASHLTVNVSNPVGVEEYVTAAKKFADWSFSTTEQRLAAYRMAEAAKEELAKCGRMQDMLAWAIDGTVPDIGAAGAAEVPEPEPVPRKAVLPAVYEGAGGGFEGADLAALVQQYLDSNNQMLERLGQGL